MGTTSRTTPTWKVQVVSDDGCCSECCGGGDPAPRTPRDESPGAFAYTIGLHERGAPELHLWARPTEGDDPGVDWSFSPRDMVLTLNGLAEELLAGRLTPGQTRTETYDGGEATVTFRLGAPGDRLDLDAFGVDPRSTVVPVSWALHRPPEGALGSADPAAVREARGLLVRLSPRPSGATSLPVAWRCDDLDFDHRGDFGPMTPVVRGLAAAVLGGARSQLVRFLAECASGYSTGLTTGTVLCLARATARRVGRTAIVDRLIDDEIPSLLTPLLRAPGWSAVVRDVEAALGGDWPAAPDVLPGLLADGLSALLTTAVVLDVAGQELRLSGTGPFLWSRSNDPLAPPELRAPSAVIREVAGLLRHLGPTDLADVLGRHDRGCAREDYLQAAGHLQGLAVTTAVGLGSIGDVLAVDVVVWVVRNDLLVDSWEWARLVLGAVCAVRAEPRRLSVELAEAFCAPYDDLVPGLREFLGLGPH